MARNNAMELFDDYIHGTGDAEGHPVESEVAAAILVLAEATLRVSTALHRLGTADAATPMGAMEAHAVLVGKKLEAAGRIIAEAIREA